MTKLGCSADKCVNNVSSMCSADIIHIQGLNAHSSSGTECKTFAQKGFTNAFKSMANTNYTGELIQMMINDEIFMTPRIKCDALNCGYNQSHRCIASDIHVFGSQASSRHGTQCETFVEK